MKKTAVWLKCRMCPGGAMGAEQFAYHMKLFHGVTIRPEDIPLKPSAREIAQRRRRARERQESK